MKRRLLNLLTALSLLPCVAVCVLWARSFPRAERVRWKRSHVTGPRQYQVIRSLFVADGLIVYLGDVTLAEYEGDEVITEPLFEPSRQPDGVSRDSATSRGFLDGLNDSDYWPRYGFLAETRGTQFAPRDGTWYTVVSIPCWAVAAPAALLPAGRLVSSVRRRLRRRRCACGSCGYDLTGNVSGVCPECGDKVGANGLR
jgi:hypothetical protein